MTLEVRCSRHPDGVVTTVFDKYQHPIDVCLSCVELGFEEDPDLLESRRAVVIVDQINRGLRELQEQKCPEVENRESI